MLMSGIVHTCKWKSTRLCRIWTKYKNFSKEQKVTDFINDFGFSLYAILSTCYIIITSEKWSEVQQSKCW